MKQTRGSPIAAACYHVNFNAVMLHDKLGKIIVRCAVDFMTWHQNIHYKISSQQKLKTDDEYVPNLAQIKLDLAIEKEQNGENLSKPSQGSTHKSLPSVS